MMSVQLQYYVIFKSILFITAPLREYEDNFSDDDISDAEDIVILPSQPKNRIDQS